MTVFINARFLAQPVSGVQRYARELLGGLDRLLAADRALRRRLEPVVALHPPGPVAEDPGWVRIRRRELPGSPGLRGGHRWEQGPLCHAARGQVLLSLGNSGPLLHRRHLLALHDTSLWEVPQAFSRPYRILHRSLRPHLARRAAGLVTVSQYSASQLSWRLGVPQERFCLIPNSAGHVLRIRPDETCLPRHGLVPQGYLLAVGNQTPNKNIPRLVQAHAAAGPQVPDLVIAGGAAPGLAAHAAPGGGRARVLGRVGERELRTLYDGAAGFVFPSLHEGFGIPPLEAMQLGVPVLAARAGALPEVLGDAPLWFDPGSAGDMARALGRFAQMRASERAQMVRKGRLQAARYCWDRAAAQLARLLSAAAGAHPAAVAAARQMPGAASGKIWNRFS